MADMNEAAWKAFTKKQKLELDDAPLLKALAAFDKTALSDPAPRVQALEQLVEQTHKQIIALAKKKKELGDKPFKEVKDKLDELLEQAERLQKEARKAKDAKDAEGDDEAESPVLLTTKMTPLVRELRKGEARFHALIGIAGNEAAVLIRRRPIGPTMRAVIAESLGVKSGVKWAPGEALFENKALTFVVKAPAGGLAKKIKAALLNQIGMRMPVRVRGEDPDDVDEEGEDSPDDTGDDAATSEAQAQAKAPDAPDTPTPEALAYVQRLRKLEAPLAQALAKPGPEAARLRSVSEFAAQKAAAGDHAGAINALQSLEKLLQAGTTAPTNAGDRTVDAGSAFKARLTALLPRIKAGGPAAGLKASEAGVHARKGEFDQANVTLDELEALLAAPSAANAPVDAPRRTTGNPQAQGAVADRLAAKSGFDTLTTDLSGARERLLEARDTLAEAFASADGQLRKLQAFLAVHPDEELRAIGGSPELGINALTAGYRVRLLAALLKLVDAPPRDLAAPLNQMRGVVAEFRYHLQSDERIEACDLNPVGIPVDIRGPVGAALARMETAVDGYAA